MSETTQKPLECNVQVRVRGNTTNASVGALFDLEGVRNDESKCNSTVDSASQIDGVMGRRVDT